MTNVHALSGLPMMQDNENSPPTPSYTIVETQRGKDFETGGYELVRDGRVVARGSGPEIIFALRDQGVRGAGKIIGMHFRDGKQVAFKVRTTAEREAKASVIVWRSDQEKAQ